MLQRLLLLVLLFSGVSCATQHAPDTSRLIGRWRYADPAQSCEYVFASDGTFRAEVKVQSRTVSRVSGRWSILPGRLLYTYEHDAMGRIPPGSKDEDKLLATSADHFDIEAADGSRRRYDRVEQAQ